jgi:5-hydroxyisourate hydrolase-like protein (transthyretin family)
MRSRFALPMAVLYCGLAAGAKFPTTKISVHVTNMAGDPIEHAEVAVKVVKGEKANTRWRLRTHEDGIASTPAEMQVPQGPIVVEVMADEYEPFSQQFEVHEDQRTIEVKLNSAMTQINVHVTTMGGRPLDHAEVVVKFVKGRSVIEFGRKLHTTWEVRTNQDGLAKVPAIPRGTILIQVNAKGYQTYGQTFDVDELQKTIEVKLNSPQEQYTAH